MDRVKAAELGVLGLIVLALVIVFTGCASPTEPELEPEPTVCTVYVESVHGHVQTFERTPDEADDFVAFMESQVTVVDAWADCP